MKNQGPSRIINPIIGIEIITLLYSEINKDKEKEKENINKGANKLKIRKCIYIPRIHIKGKINKNMQNNCGKRKWINIKNKKKKEKKKKIIKIYGKWNDSNKLLTN